MPGMRESKIKHGNLVKPIGENKMPALFGTLFMITIVGAWFTHIITCLQDGSWGFLIAGALMFPIAIIHGFGIWIGVF